MSENNISTSRNAIILLPILVIGTFSFGYLTFNSVQQPNLPAIESTTTPETSKGGVEVLDGVSLPAVPELAPVEQPQAPAQPQVVPGGNVNDANNQTGASETLQGNGAKLTNPNANVNQKLQAPNNSKLQTRGLLFP